MIRRNPMPALERLWESRTARERHVLLTLALLVGLLLAYGICWQPAQNGIVRLESELPSLRSELDRMHVVAGEIMAAHGRVGSAAVPEGERTRQLQLSLQELGQGKQKLEYRAEGQWTLEWREAPFSTMADWLDLVQHKWHMSVVEAHVERASRPGSVNARLVLRGAE